MNVSSTIRAASSVSASPPTRIFSVPSRACLASRVIGASKKCPPAAVISEAIFSVVSGNEVEQSTMIAPSFIADMAPLSPVSTASTWGAPVTHKIIRSASAAIAAEEDCRVAPILMRSLTGWFPGWSIKTSEKPAFNILSAIPCPMRPTPIIPTFMLPSP